MEIVLKEVSYRYKGKTILDSINTIISSEKITGITGDGKTKLLEIIDGVIKPNAGIIEIGNLSYSKNHITEVRRAVALIMQDVKKQFFTTTVKEEMTFLTTCLKYENKNITKKMYESLNIVGLSEEYFDKNIFQLTSGEKKLIQIAISLLSNPKVIIFDEPFTELDYHNKRKMIKLIKQLKIKYNKTIVIASNDSNLLYTLADEVIVLKDGKLLIKETSTKLFKDIKFLEDNNIEIPMTSQFTYLAKNRKVKLMYHKDILDLIKDIYKHV